LIITNITPFHIIQWMIPQSTLSLLSPSHTIFIMIATNNSNCSFPNNLRKIPNLPISTMVIDHQVSRSSLIFSCPIIKNWFVELNNKSTLLINSNYHIWLKYPWIVFQKHFVVFCATFSLTIRQLLLMVYLLRILF